MLDEFIAYLEREAENHSIYVIGGQGKRGKDITEAWIRSRESDQKNADRAVAFWKKQCEAGYADKLGAFDCSGLGMYFLQNLKGVYPADLNANGMKGKCTQISKDEVRRGDWVFMLSESHATHIGFVVDEEKNVIEARGRDYGVCKAPLSSRSWQYFGRPEIFKSEIEAEAKALTPSSTVKKGDTGDAVLALQCGLLAAGYHLPKYGADGEFGNETLNAIKQLQADKSLPQSGTAGDVEAKALGLTNGFILSDAIRLLGKSLTQTLEDNTSYLKKLEELKRDLLAISEGL